jgi:hypothetical protein
VGNLNVSALHGFTPYRFEAAATVTWLAPKRSVSSRDDQCVTPSRAGGGVSVSVRSDADPPTASYRSAAHRSAPACRARHSGPARYLPSAGSPPPADQSPHSGSPRQPATRSGPAPPTRHVPHSITSARPACRGRPATAARVQQ